jgi:NADH dehydrogenase FAD-containing subunit
MGKHLILVGGGHAHLETLSRLGLVIQAGHRVTLVGPSPYHYYSGMGPGMLGKSYSPAEIRFAIRHMVEKQGGTFVQDTVVHVDPIQKKIDLQSGTSLSYDVISFNTGSSVPTDLADVSGTDVYTVKPIERLIDAQKRILDGIADAGIRIAVVGGGAAAVELAGNVWRLARTSGGRLPKIRIFAGNGLLDAAPAKVRQKVRRSLTKRGIDIMEPGFVERVTDGFVVVSGGRKYASEITLLAVGVKPSPLFEASGLPVGADGGLRVNQYLQSTGYPEIFGGGDCVYFDARPLDKVGVYAVRQNPVLFHNLRAALDGGPLRSFDPGGGYLLIFNLGDGTGVLHKKGFTLNGRLAFVLKDRIDRRFMRKYQESA